MGETCLGDGLYVSDDGFQIALRTPRREGDHFVVLETSVLMNLFRFIERSRNLSILINPKDGETLLGEI